MLLLRSSVLLLWPQRPGYFWQRQVVLTNGLCVYKVMVFTFYGSRPSQHSDRGHFTTPRGLAMCSDISGTRPL